MKRSVVRHYEHKKSYDFADYDTMVGRRFNKKRAHKRFRRQIVCDKDI